MWAFDDIDLCITHHITPGDDIIVGSGTGNGFVSKVIRCLGKAAHAAGTPEQGVNALSAASLGLQALGLNRETFRDEDCVRINQIITNLHFQRVSKIKWSFGLGLKIPLVLAQKQRTKKLLSYFRLKKRITKIIKK